MTDLNEKYWDLIEKSDFEDLSSDEQQFVLKHFSEADFKYNRSINEIAASDDVNTSSSNRSAILAAAGSTPKHNYKYLIGVAAGIAIMLGLFNVFYNGETTEGIAQKVYLTDTIVKNTTIYDTLYIKQEPKEIVKTVYIEKELSFPKTTVDQTNYSGRPTTAISTINHAEIQNKGIRASVNDITLINTGESSSRFR